MVRHAGRAEPYLLPVLLVVVTVLGLIGDALTRSLAAQQVLGLLCFGVLAVGAWSMPVHYRRQIWLLVLTSVPIELFGSILWGAYRYRFLNVPLYVPPGHGLVYLFSLRMAMSPLFERHRQAVIGAALTVATLWMISGLVYWPSHGGRLDVFGLICWPILVVFSLRTSRGALFAAAFFATSMVEVLGTAVGDWGWVDVTPVVHIATGNPPSVAAGLYCLLDATVLVCSRALIGLGRRWKRHGLESRDPVSVIGSEPA